MDTYEPCSCSFRWTDTHGTHEVGTNAWKPDRPTVHIQLLPHPDCPKHPSVECHGCDERMITLPTQPVTHLDRACADSMPPRNLSSKG